MIFPILCTFEAVNGKQIKLALFILTIALFFGLKQFTSVGDFMTVEYLRSAIEPLGAWGILIFIAAFGFSAVLQIPGILFYSASFMIFGTLAGGLIAYTGSVLAVILSFYFARHMGGDVLSGIKSDRVKKIMGKLEDQPVLVIGVLRTFMWVSPPLNYALAFSRVSSGKYILGSVIGLTVPVICMITGYNCFFS